MDNQIAFTAYDTLCSVRILAAREPEEIPGLLAQAEETARELERTLSMFDPESELSQLCRRYTPGVPYPVSGLVSRFLADNLDIAARSKGAFDPTVGPLVRLWDFLADTPAIPDPEALEAARARVGWGNIHLDRQGGTVTLDLPGMVIDPGASGKGLSLELVAEGLRRGGVSRAILDFGGNLFAIGGKGGQDGEAPWQVGIRDPDHGDRVIGTVPLLDAGIATSSWYEHCFCKDGTVYHHLLDPRTGTPVPLTLKSVSILSSRGVLTDLLSTAFFVLGEEAGAAMADRLRADSGARIEYVAVRRDNSILASPGAGFRPAEGGR